MIDQTEENWVKEVLKGKDGIKEVLEVSAEPAVGKNENYGSALYRLNLKLKMMDNQITGNSVILKLKSVRKSSYSAKEEEYIFDVETKVYSEVFTAMEQLMKQNNDNEERLWPRYLAHKKLCLLIEDLSPEGYGILPKEKPLDETHTHAVMEVCGKLHGISLVLTQQQMFPAQNLRTYIINGDVMVFPKFFSSGVKGLLEVMKQWGPEWKDIIPEVQKIGENIAEKMRDLAIQTEQQGPCVFNHGDCWTNNILFKYDNYNFKPSQIRLVDFQMGHFNSPAWDLTYFFYNALLPKERFKKMHLYLKSYSESLSETLKKYSFKGQIPSLEDILRSVQGLSYYGFLTSITIRPLLIASTQEGFCLESHKLLDDFPGGPQCIHRSSYYVSPEVHDILKEEIKQYLNINK